MLDMYGVKMNHTLDKMIASYVILPGDNSLACSDEIQQHLRQTHRQHEVELETVLLLRKSVTLKILMELLSEIKAFLIPILDQVDFFVHFNLRNCKLFSKYLKFQMDVISSSQFPVKLSDVQVTIFSAESQESSTEPDKKIMQVQMNA